MTIVLVVNDDGTVIRYALGEEVSHNIKCLTRLPETSPLSEVISGLEEIRREQNNRLK